MRHRRVFLFCWLALAVKSGAQTTAVQQCLPGPAAAAKTEDPLAVVAGQALYARDIETAMAAQMVKIRNQEFQAKSTALEDVIRQRVIQAEASRRGLTTEQLYVAEVDSRIGLPGDEAVEVYYLALKSQFNRPLTEIKPQLLASLKALEIQDARQRFADFLRAKADVTILLRPPRTEVTFGPDRLLGDPEAPVTIVEFADYQCPYCKSADATVRNLLKKYPCKVRLAFRDYPLSSIHPNAQLAAEATACAAKAGKFWEFHDALFADQSRLDASNLVTTAKDLGLNPDAFQTCLSSHEFTQRVAADQQDGAKAGVTATPAFFVNGVFLNGAQPEAEFAKLIDAELASQKTKAAPAAAPKGQ